MDRGIFSKFFTISDGHNAIIAKVALDVNYSEDGSIARYKARLVTQCFIHVYKIDFQETFTPTICYNAS